MLKCIRELAPHLSIFFVCVPSPTDHMDNINVPISESDNDHLVDDSPEHGASLADQNAALTNSADSGLDNSNELDKRFRHAMYLTDSESDSLNLFHQLVHINFLSVLPTGDKNSTKLSDYNSDSSSEHYNCDSELVEDFSKFSQIIPFTRQVLRTYLLQTISLLNVVHTRCLHSFICVAYDMARDMLITPKRLEFAKSKEIELYSSLMEIAVKKQDEIRILIEQTIERMREELLEKAAGYEFIGKLFQRYFYLPFLSTLTPSLAFINLCKCML